MADNKLKHRINAGRVAINKQVDFFHEQFGQGHSDWKDDKTCVSFTDFVISEKIFSELRKSFAKDDYCSEESNPLDEQLELNAQYAWILNPVDSAHNYALGIPFCSISLALLKNGIPVYGYVYDMSRQKLIEGGPQQGLYDGCRKVSIKSTPLDEHSIIGMNFPLTYEKGEQLKPLLSSYHLCSMQSSVLNPAYTAIGILDGCLGFDDKIWNIAASYALCLAGGGAFHFLGKSIFPLKQLQPALPEIEYFSGSLSFCRMVKRLYSRTITISDLSTEEKRFAR